MYYCNLNILSGLMSEIKDNFIKILDFSQCGISHNMDQLMCLLRQCDPQLYEALDKRSIKPQVSCLL